MSDKQTNKIETVQRSRRASRMTRRSCTKSGLQYEAMFVVRGVFLVVGYFRTKGERRNAQRGESDVGHATG